MKAVSIDEMGNAIAKEFEQYVDLTADEVKKIVAEVAEDVKEKIREEAPVDTGAYKKSWAVTQTKKSALGAEYTVHSKEKYRLTHLLEFGHAKRGGGRTKAQPHIAKGESLAISKIKQKMGVTGI
ncbi:MAG: HK97 gp10 family phage protein [Ruminococcus flavefaciens]|nr:HK97 gp10 family phage protein [Ruminococcus flavefaciens]